MSNSINIILSSHANCDIFPRNTHTKFTNRLPNTLTNRGQQQFHVRLCWLAFANDSSGTTRSPTYLEVHISEIEGQWKGREVTTSVGGFTHPLAERLGADYGACTFRQTPYLPVKFQQLSTLEVTLVDKFGNEPEIFTQGLPTLVWIEMTDKPVQNQFTIQCVSGQPSLFPTNELGRFTIPIPSELELADYEVALQQIIYPPLMEDKAAEAAVSVNEEDYTFNLRLLDNTRDFITAVSNEIYVGTYGDVLEFGKRGDIIYFRRKITNDPDLDGKPIRITPSKTFCMACGQTSIPRRTTELLPGRMFSFRGTAGIQQALPNPIAMLDCDLVKTNILAGDKSTILQAVPLKIGINEQSPRLYEPENLIYQPVQARPFNTIRFKFLEPDGRPKYLESYNPEESIIVTLVFRRKI